MTDAEAHNHGMDGLPAHAERYGRAEEFTSVLLELWESWPAEAILADRGGAYVDESRLRAVDHSGDHFSVAGPLNISSTPQGRPVIFQAGASAPGRDLAARFADGIDAVAWGFAQALNCRQDVLARAAAAGRDPDSVTVMPGLVTYVAPSEAGAREIQAELNELLPVADSLRQLAFFTGQDTSGWELDGPASDLPAPTGGVHRPAGTLRHGAADHRDHPTDGAQTPRLPRRRGRARRLHRHSGAHRR